MTQEEYKKIAHSIHRSLFVKSIGRQNKIKKAAHYDMAQLITCDIIGTFKQDPNFNEKEFLDACGITIAF